jgi:hypothetical protein
MSTSTIAAGLLAALVVYVYTAHRKVGAFSAHPASHMLTLLSGPLQLAHIPTVGGPSWPLLSYISAVRYFKHASEMYAQGSQRVRLRVACTDEILNLDPWPVPRFQGRTHGPLAGCVAATRLVYASRNAGSQSSSPAASLRASWRRFPTKLCPSTRQRTRCGSTSLRARHISDASSSSSLKVS